MTIEETGKVFAHLKAGKPRFFQTITAEELSMMIIAWFDCLNDLSYEVVSAAVKSYLNSVPYMPEIYDIRQKAMELMRPELTVSPDAVYNQVIRAIALPGGFAANSDRFSPQVIEAVKQFGLRRLQFEDSSDVKESFIKFYTSHVRREMTTPLNAPALPSAPIHAAKALNSATQPPAQQRDPRKVVDLTSRFKSVDDALKPTQSSHVRKPKPSFAPKTEAEYAEQKAKLLAQKEALQKSA